MRALIQDQFHLLDESVSAHPGFLVCVQPMKPGLSCSGLVEPFDPGCWNPTFVQRFPSGKCCCCCCCCPQQPPTPIFFPPPCSLGTCSVLLQLSSKTRCQVVGKKVPPLCFSDTAERKEQRAANDQHHNELIISQRQG